METEGYRDLPETSDGQGVGLLDGRGGGAAEEDWSAPYPLGFQVSLTTVLILELVLGFSSNLTVLVLYCAQSNLVDSVSNLVTVNLHVLDILVCVLCLPLTVAVILVPANGSGVGSLATLCCFHEACVTFTSVATAVNVLVISLDRYDISVRPASRLLNPRRAGLLLAAVWAVSLAVFFLPFLEGDFFSSRDEDGEDELPGMPNMDSESPTGHTALFSSPSPSVSPSRHPAAPSHNLSPLWQNRTLLCVGGQGYYTGMAMYYHLLLQVPCFFIAVVVMLFTYSRILQALNIRIGSHMMRGSRTKDSTCRIRCRTRKTQLTSPTEAVSSNQNQNLSHPPLIPSPTPTSPPPLCSVPQAISDSGATVTTVSTAATTPIATTPATPASPTLASGSTQTRATSPLPASSMGVQASVSAIIALRRAVRRHRDRRERQRRVLKMSLIIISTFLGCWAPLSAVNILILCLGPSDGLVRIRLCFLAMAYGTTIFHPLLYAFTRQKLRRALKTRVKKRVVSLLQVDPAPIGGTVIHNSWVEGGGQRKSRKPRVEASDGTDRCLTEAVRE
uniref:G-protein coupled receptor 22 n=1 Tax=Doryrhamphus excisus TaxID=161450 RepID=UPI0025ADA788|nr:G-protein coupled receptor 22 [Doryrhamphus excisus]XP_057911351.1 G-protein coupled receptor 22 [Doryrhamphus excisus]XP_057911352.1 G-protein coupled receptor 22 [Doryrhamphus excisus]XP_057911353.1 G-protein coupled receptor 22 [Doryrhamphus excisus]